MRSSCFCTVGGSARDRLCQLALDLGLVAQSREDATSSDVVHRRQALSSLTLVGAYEPCRQLILVETPALLLAAVGLALGWVHPAIAGVVLLVSAGTGMVLSVAAVVLNEVAEPGSRPGVSDALVSYRDT